jgi:cytochrome c biogenesis protein CcdA
MFLKKRRGRFIRRITEDKQVRLLAAIALSTGVVISLLEFACTGQVLLPVIAAIQESSSFGVGLVYLLIYTSLFILPLLVILYLFYRGSSSASIGGTYTRVYRYTKILIGAFLIALGLVMLWRVFG